MGCEYRKHLVIPDTHIRPGVPDDHVLAAARAAIEYKPDVVVHLGDHWDLPSLSRHEPAGGMHKDGARLKDDLEYPGQSIMTFRAIIEKEVFRIASNHKRRWFPRFKFLIGNHEEHLDRVPQEQAVYDGIIGTHLLNKYLHGWEVHPFLSIMEEDGILYSHYFQSLHSHHAIGGTITNRLNKIGRSFVQGHEQGFLYAAQQYPGKLRRHGLVVGSFYQHEEPYRGPQGNEEWRGIVMLNEVREGTFDVMPLSMRYVLERFN